MKKILILVLIILTGCAKNEPLVIDNQPQNISKFEKAYYHRIKSCMYEKSDLLICDYISDKYFLVTDEDVIEFVKPYNQDTLHIDGFGYNISGNTIYLDKENFNGLTKIEYQFDKSVVNNGIIITQYLNNEDTLPLTVIQVYEKITKEEYIRKTGAINEK